MQANITCLQDRYCRYDNTTVTEIIAEIIVFNWPKMQQNLQLVTLSLENFIGSVPYFGYGL